MQWEVCYVTPVESEAHVVKGFLEHYGVPCMLDDRRFAAQPLTFSRSASSRCWCPAIGSASRAG